MPPCRTEPLFRWAPDRMLPVWPGWMPTPVAALLNNPEMTFKRDRKGAIGCRLLLNSMSAPELFAHQCGGQMPLPMNSTANRLGAVAAAVPVVDSPARNGIDSSHGRARVTPTP